MSPPALWDYAVRHLHLKARNVRPGTVERDELSLRHVVDYFGDRATLRDITVEGLTDYLEDRRRAPGSRKGTTLAAQTLRHELTALSSLFRRALSEGRAELNPVALLVDKPRIERDEPAYLEVDEMAHLIRAAYDLDQRHHNRAVPFLGPLVETFAYVGGRRNEIFGAEVRDVDFVNRNFHIRANDIRTLKRGQHRVVPLWPRLRTALRAYLKTHAGSGLLFPAETGGMLKDVRASLESAVAAAKIDKNVTLTTLRHTYGATRIQTLDQGAPVHLFTVAREMGHRSVTMIEKHYGHLQHVRHRKPAVEYVDNVVEFRVEAKGA